MLTAFQRWWRARIVARTPIADRLWRRTLDSLPFLRGLTQEELLRLRNVVALFLHYKSIHGAAGLEFDEYMRMVIAVQACILILNLDIDYYRGWVEIIVYPAEFVPTVEYVDDSGVTHVGREVRVGEAWLGGPVILSWQEVSQAEDGMNVVIHEFAHKLDMLNGDANGYPPLHRGMNRQAWSAAFEQAYQDFCRRVERDEELPIDPYASEAPAEFFAVLSETFFLTPGALADYYPSVYEQLCMFYRQDPASRMARDGLSLWPSRPPPPV